MKTWPTILSLVLLVILAMVSLLVQGSSGRRWGLSSGLLAAGQRLSEIPNGFGDWRLEDRQELNDEIKNVLECAGEVLGTYVNEATGESLTCVLLLGPPGPISVHTPDICYSSQEYTIVQPPREVQISGTTDPSDRFWVINLRSRSVDATKLRVYYGWSDGGCWSAARHPRFVYATFPRLYKIQVACYPGPDGEFPEDDAGRRFLRDFLAAAKPHMVAPES